MKSLEYKKTFTVEVHFMFQMVFSKHCIRYIIFTECFLWAFYYDVIDVVSIWYIYTLLKKGNVQKQETDILLHGLGLKAVPVCKSNCNCLIMVFVCLHFVLIKLKCVEKLLFISEKKFPYWLENWNRKFVFIFMIQWRLTNGLLYLQLKKL